MPTTEDLNQLQTDLAIAQDDYAYLSDAIQTLTLLLEEVEGTIADLEMTIAECEDEISNGGGGGELRSASKAWELGKSAALTETLEKVSRMSRSRCSQYRKSEVFRAKAGLSFKHRR